MTSCVLSLVQSKCGDVANIIISDSSNVLTVSISNSETYCPVGTVGQIVPQINQN